jgi:hypothetical protein
MAEGNHLQIKRGLFANIGTLAAGELALATDTNVLYVGDGAANHAVLMLPSGTAHGDLLYFSAAGTPAVLAHGTDDQVLHTHTDGSAPAWGATPLTDEQVTYAKIQHVSATDKLLGRSTAGAGDVEEIACTATGRSILDDTTTAAVCTTIGALPLAGGTMSGDITLGENTAIALDPAGSADEKWSGITVSGTAGATLVVGDLCYLNSAWKWVLTDANAAASAGSVALGLCVLAAAGDTAATNMLLLGTMRSAAFPASITGGAQLYVSTTAGDMTTTQPTGVDDVIRVVGWAILTEPNTIYFAPSSDYITRTA